MSHKRVGPIFLGLFLVLLALVLAGCRSIGGQGDPPIATLPALATSTAIPVEAPSPTLESAAWSLISYADHKGRQVGTLAGTEITITFQDNQVSGSAGCNNYFSIYEQDAESLTLTDAGVTEMYCMAPEGIMEQEAGYLEALQSIASYQLADDRLQLLDGQGRTILIFRRA